MPRVARHRIRVRYAECDPLGIVFNANFFVYFDVVLTELWRDAGVSYAAMAQDGLETAVVEATARFRAPARFDDELDLEAGVEHLGRTSIVTRYRVLRDEELLCEGRLAHVCVDRRTHQKAAIPDQVRSALGAALGP
jgi:acyl-CoA thioester hydrolase